MVHFTMVLYHGGMIMISEEKRNRILDYAFRKFITAGIAQITMDDIARGVGMGKGTLYQYFPSKEGLILHTIDYIVFDFEKKLDRIMEDQSLTSVEKLSLYLKAMAERLSSLNPSLLEYLERSMPAAYEKIEKIRQHIIEDKLGRLLAEGKKDGLFDSSIEDGLVIQMMIGSVNHIIHTHAYNRNMGSDQLFRSIISILLKGCLTEEGRKLAKDTL